MINCTHTTPHHIIVYKQPKRNNRHNLLEQSRFPLLFECKYTFVHAHAYQSHSKTQLYKREYQQWNIISYKTCKIVSHCFSHLFPLAEWLLHTGIDMCRDDKNVFDVDISKQSSSWYVPFEKLPLHSSKDNTFDTFWYTCELCWWHSHNHFVTLYSTTFDGNE